MAWTALELARECINRVLEIGHDVYVISDQFGTDSDIEVSILSENICINIKDPEDEEDDEE